MSGFEPMGPGGGDGVGASGVTGAASSTDNAVARYDGTTGKLLQNSSGVTITDNNALVVVASAAATTAITGTGNTSGAGGVFQGGNTNSNGVTCTGVGSGHGVQGTGGATGHGGNFIATGSGNGLLATGVNNSSSYGVFATNTGSGHGIIGQATGSGTAIVANNGATGYSLHIEGDTTSPVKAPVKFVPQNAEPTGAHLVGDMYMTSAGVLKVCTGAGTPGTWTSVGAQT